MANELQADVNSLKNLDASPFHVATGKSGLVGGGVGEAILIYLGKVAVGVTVKIAVDLISPHARKVWDRLFVPKIKQDTESTAFGKEAERNT
jgi:hypothetical protein